MADPADAFGLFVSCVDGQPVTRYGTNTMIGADRIETILPGKTVLGNPRGSIEVTYRPADVIAIPHEEYSRYRREYDRALRDGSLVRRTKDDWRQQNRQEKPTTTKKQGAGTPPAPE